MKVYKNGIRSTTSKGVEYKDSYVYTFREIDDPKKFDIYQEQVSVDLDPCPFCGVNGTLNGSASKSWYGWCSICGTEGPSHYLWYKAAEMWNNRTLKTVIENKSDGDAELIEQRKKKYRTEMDLDRFTEESRAYVES